MGQAHPSTPEQRAQWAATMLAHQGEYGLVTTLSREHRISRPTLYAWREQASLALQQAFAPPDPLPVPSPTARHILTLWVNHAAERSIQAALRELLHRGISLQTIVSTLHQAEQRALAWMQAHVPPSTRALALDEIYANNRRGAYLNVVDVHSGAVWAAEGPLAVDTDSWTLVLWSLQDRGLRWNRVVMDEGAPMHSACLKASPQVLVQLDQWHLWHSCAASQARLERVVERLEQQSVVVGRQAARIAAGRRPLGTKAKTDVAAHAREARSGGHAARCAAGTGGVTQTVKCLRTLSKQVIFDESARSALHHGVNILAQAVRTTLGPRGRNVALDQKWGLPTITHDGVTVARDIELKNPFENLGAQLLKQAASKTSDVAGDGTTSSTVLAEALVDEGLRVVAAGANPLLLKRGLDRAVRVLVEEIHRQAIPVAGRTEVAQIATISAQDAEIGELLATIIETKGRDAVIAVEEGKGLALEYELGEGMQFDRGYISPYFATDTAKLVAELDEPTILIADTKISAVADLLPLLEALVHSGKQELLIIAEDVDDEALAALVVNKLRGTLNPLAVKAPSFGERRKATLVDIAILTGSTVISEEAGRTLSSATLADLGRARRVTANKDTTVIVEGAGERDAIQARLAQLNDQIVQATADYDKEQLRERAARLAGGVTVIKVGAPTETAMKERKARLDDALHATRAALAEGVVTGGGVGYLNLASVLDTVPTSYDEERLAVNMLRRELEQPTRLIVANAGIDGAVVVEEIKRRQRERGQRSIGYDVVRDDYGDLVSWGVIDPAKVVRTALENAVSVAGMILSTDTLIAEVPEGTQPGSGFAEEQGF